MSAAALRVIKTAAVLASRVLLVWVWSFKCSEGQKTGRMLLWCKCYSKGDYSITSTLGQFTRGYGVNTKYEDITN